MADIAKQKFSFEVQGFDKDTFHVVRFTGQEGLSMLYRFEIILVAQDKKVDFDKALSNTATFTIMRSQGDIPFHGILERLEQLQHSGPNTYYRAVLVPKAWWLTQTVHNQVFLQKDNQAFLADVLKDAGLSDGLDFSVELKESYPTWEYVCQYGETHFAFVSRWMERDGLYYFFQQTDSGEKMVITDNLTAHAPMEQGKDFRYEPPSNMALGHEDEVVSDFTLQQQRLPKTVQLKDYNYETPSLEVIGKAQVSQNGRGMVYLYGLHFLTPDEGDTLANIRAQDLQCREKIFSGVSAIPFVRPGYTFTLANHYRDDFNQRYQTITVSHEGSQEAYLVTGLGLRVEAEHDSLLYYRNSFTAIPANVQFRPKFETPRPNISGTLNAKVDAAGSDQYAEVDSQGRYKVILPFDQSGRKDGQASAWIRMAQPYAGQNFGMHLPLHKGAEVLLSFIDGHPDRPLIAAAVPNPETPSPVNDQNQTMSCLTSAGGNNIHIEDKEGSQRILLHSTAKGDFIRIGAHNDPPSFGDVITDMATDGINLTTPQWFNVKAEFANQIILGDNTQLTVGLFSCSFIGASVTLNVGASITTNCAVHTEFSPVWYEIRGSVRDAAATKEKAYGDLTAMVGEHTKLIGDGNTVTGTLTTTVGDHTKTIGAHTKLIGDETKTTGTLLTTVGEHTKTIGEHTETIGAHTKTIGEHTETIGAHTKTIGEHTKTVGEHTETIGSLTKMAGQVSQLAENVSVLATAIEYI